MKQLDRIVKQIRKDWPSVQIVIRADSGFCRDNIMSWCEANDVKFVLGLAKNKRLKWAIGKELHQAKQKFEATGEAARVFKDFCYKTKKSWSQERRVIRKAEYLAKGENPRFVVTNLPMDEIGAAIRVTVRKVWVSLSQSYPYAETFIRVLENLRALPRPSPG